VVLTLLVGIHKDEDIVSTNGRNDEDCQRVQRCKVLDLEDDREDEPV
jgi:hypothetical protein